MITSVPLYKPVSFNHITITSLGATIENKCSHANPFVLSPTILGGRGRDGLSAYQVWINNGNTGTEQDFLVAIGSADVTALADRITDVEEATDGLHLGVEPLQYYIIARDN